MTDLPDTAARLNLLTTEAGKVARRLGSRPAAEELQALRFLCDLHASGYETPIHLAEECLERLMVLLAANRLAARRQR